MKKNMVRILAFALVVIMALSILPLASFADSYLAGVTTTNRNPSLSDVDQILGSVKVPDGTTIKTSDYDSLIHLDGEKYDLQGIANVGAITNPDAAM